MSTAPYAFYFAGMDMNVDLLQAAYDCLKPHVPAHIPVYIGLEEDATSFNGAHILRTPKGKQWTGRVRDHLEQIREPYVIVLLEDYFIHGLNHTQLNDLIPLMESFKAGVIKLHAVPKPDYGLAGQSNLGLFTLGRKLGRTNTQPALWRKDYLQSLLLGDESLWEFEINGSIRSNAADYTVLGVYRHVIDYDEVVKRGKFRNRYKKRYADVIARYNIDRIRGFLTWRWEIRFEAHHTFSQILQKICPQHIRSRIKHWFTSTK